ncbi:MAG TPA: hypothetical protein VFB36_14765 [Nevskiaceae bacterium]|nr:hypothetical protein [Nevskiaceae bacterium]
MAARLFVLFQFVLVALLLLLLSYFNLVRGADHALITLSDVGLVTLP